MKIESEKLENSVEDEKFLSANGKEIFVTEETKRHLSAHPDVVEFFEEAISKANIPEGTTRFKETINLGREVGISSLIETKPILPDEETDFAMRIEREYPVRISLNVEGSACDSVTLKIVFDEKSQKYFLITAYIGQNTPSNPYYTDRATDEYKESLDFWCSHALAYDPKIMEKPFKASWNSILTRARLLS
jgi:hypothetical protein